jgi:3-hydroxybutyryl-CoA dehydratase
VSWQDATSDRAFEDFALDETIETPGRTVEVSDIIAFAGLTGDHYPLHVNEQYASQTQFGGRIAHGPLTFSIAVGEVGLTGWYGTAIVALVECTNLRATAPVRPGDTIRVRATVVELAAARSPKHGTLHVDYDVVNQRSETVMTFHWVMLATRRTPLADSND